MKQPNSLSLEAVLDEPIPFAFELFFSTEGIDREPLLAISPVRLEGQVFRIEKGFALEARLAYGGRLECSRCLEPYPFERREDFSLILAKRAPVAEREVSLEGEDLDLYFYDEPVIPVAPIAEERIQMAVPMKPLCREDCRGLCPRCGENLNLAECGCTPQPADPRWEELQALKKV